MTASSTQNVRKQKLNHDSNGIADDDQVRALLDFMIFAGDACRITSREVKPLINLPKPGHTRATQDSVISGVADDTLGDLLLTSLLCDAADTVHAVRTQFQNDPHLQRPIGMLARALAETVGAISWLAESESPKERQARALLHLFDSLQQTLNRTSKVDPRAKYLQPFATTLQKLYRETGIKVDKQGNSGFIKCIKMDFDNGALYSTLSSLSHPDAFSNVVSYITSHHEPSSAPQRARELVRLAAILPALAVHAVAAFNPSDVLEDLDKQLWHKAQAAFHRVN